MKKFAVLLFALTVLTVCFGFETNPTPANAAPIHTHNHADAIYHGFEKEDTAQSVWQCRKCGQRMYHRSMPSEWGCGGEMSNRHVWERIG